MKWRKKKSGYPSVCCWCGKKLSNFSPVYGLNAKFRKDAETPPVEDDGYLVELYVHESMDSAGYKPVKSIVVGNNSDAKKAGSDIIFMLCSKDCGRELKEILQADIGFIDKVLGEEF